MSLGDSADLLHQDTVNRQQALDLGLSLIVQAPAGAGKTELLTQRFLGLLARVDHPEQIVAITFTRKAAAEMRNRILKRLEQAGRPAPASAHERHSWQLAQAAMAADSRRGWALLANPDRLRITTIDALCASLVRQMPYLSQFGGTPRIAEKPDRHYQEAARRTLLAVEEVPAVATALAHLDNDAGKLQRLLVAMLAFRDQWLVHLPGLVTAGDQDLRAALRLDLVEGLRRLVERDLARAATALAATQTPELMAMARYAAAAVSLGDTPQAAPLLALRDWCRPLLGTVDELPRWQALAALLLTRSGKRTPRKVFGKDVGLAAEKGASDAPAISMHKAVLKAACAGLEADEVAWRALLGAASCPAPVYAEADLATIEAFVEVLIKAYANLWCVFQENGETDFVEVAGKALKALGEEGEPSDLALKLDYALSHLLVDEFQDTNRHQIALLERLTAGWLPEDGRTLFLVGDPMQSIYRFRKADVGLFLRAWSQGIGAIKLQPLKLYRNNRSLPPVVDWVNAVFPGIFPAAVDAERGMVVYSPAIATKQQPAPAIASGAFCHPLVIGAAVEEDADRGRDDNDEAVPAEADAAVSEDGDELEARRVLEIIDAEWRVDAARDIAILVRARGHLRALVREIRRHRPELRYEAVEIESLAGRQPIQDLLALTRAMVHRADRVNWLAVLRAPWCGLTLADMFLLARPQDADRVPAAQRPPLPTLWSLLQDEARLASLSADGQLRLSHLRLALGDALQYPRRVALRRQVESVWLRLGGRLCLDSAADQEDVDAYFRLLDKLEASGRFDLDGLEAEVGDLFAAPSTHQQAGRLKLMTVHKAKGLEFDTVILPGLHRKTGRDEQRLLLWEESGDSSGASHLVVAPYRRVVDQAAAADGVAADNSEAIRAYIDKLEQARLDQENRRVLYVAATRAIRCLHLLGVAKAGRDRKTGTQQLLKPVRGTPLAILWSCLGGDFAAALQQQLDLRQAQSRAGVEAAGQADFADFVPRLRRLRASALPQAAMSALPALAAAELGEGGPLFHAESALAPHVGTLVHRYLDLIVRQGLDAWDQARVRALGPYFEKWLRQRGHDAAESRLGMERVERALQNAIGDERGRWILRARPEAASELAVTSLEEGAMRNNIVDRTFIDDGVRWVIDYKTGQHEGGAVEAFIAAKRSEYAEQLARYAALFREEGLPLRKAIYFVDLNRFEIC